MNNTKYHKTNDSKWLAYHFNGKLKSMMEIIIYKSAYGTTWLKGGCFGKTCLQAVETQKPYSSRPINNNDYKMFRKGIQIGEGNGNMGRERSGKMGREGNGNRVRRWEYKLEVNGVDRNLGNGIGYRKGRDRNRGGKGSWC